MLITYVKKVKDVGLYNYTVWKVYHKVRNILYRDAWPNISGPYYWI